MNVEFADTIPFTLSFEHLLSGNYSGEIIALEGSVDPRHPHLMGGRGAELNVLRLEESAGG